MGDGHQKLFIERQKKNSSEIENYVDHVVIGGDINADFTRKTKYVELIKDFVRRNEIEKAWDEHPVSFTHAMEKEGVTYTSTIDHFFWNKSLSDSIEDAGVISLPENKWPMS